MGTATSNGLFGRWSLFFPLLLSLNFQNCRFRVGDGCDLEMRDGWGRIGDVGGLGVEHYR